MIGSVCVYAPLPLALRLGGGKPDAVGGSAVPEHRTPQFPSAVVGEDHPGIDLGIGVRPHPGQ